MMFSQTTEYALRAVVYLADNTGEPKTTQEIADTTKIPPGYLSKVLQTLSKAGIVLSQRGLGGGNYLAKWPGDITVYEVVQAVTPIQRITMCPLGLEGHGTNLCALHRRLDDAMATVEEAFKASTLLDLLTEDRDSYPLCSMRPAVPRPLQIQARRREEEAAEV